MATAAVPLTAEEVMDLDPYSFLAALGKKVVRPGGHRSTEELFSLAQLTRKTTSSTSAAASARPGSRSCSASAAR